MNLIMDTVHKGGDGDDTLYSVEETADGSFIVTGTTESGLFPMDGIVARVTKDEIVHSSCDGVYTTIASPIIADVTSLLSIEAMTVVFTGACFHDGDLWPLVRAGFAFYHKPLPFDKMKMKSICQENHSVSAFCFEHNTYARVQITRRIPSL